MFESSLKRSRACGRYQSSPRHEACRSARAPRGRDRLRSSRKNVGFAIFASAAHWIAGKRAPTGFESSLERSRACGRNQPSPRHETCRSARAPRGRDRLRSSRKNSGFTVIASAAHWIASKLTPTGDLRQCRARRRRQTCRSVRAPRGRDRLRSSRKNVGFSTFASASHWIANKFAPTGIAFAGRTVRQDK